LVVVVRTRIGVQHLLERLLLADAVHARDRTDVETVRCQYAEEEIGVTITLVEYGSLEQLILDQCDGLLLWIVQLTDEWNLRVVSLHNGTVGTNVGLSIDELVDS